MPIDEPIESDWWIDDIQLPIAPTSDNRTVSRTFQSETLFQFFPSISKSSARAFDYTVTGFIYPEYRVRELDQLAKSADTNIVLLRIPASEQVFNSTLYAIKKLVVNRKGPLFIKYSPTGVAPFVEVKAFPFTVTFTELPDKGENQEGADGFPDADETSLGLQNLNQLTELLTPEGDIIIYLSLSNIEQWRAATGNELAI